MESKDKYPKHIILIVFSGILFYVALLNLNVIFGFIQWIGGLFFPFFIGGAIAFILNVPMKQIESNLFKKWIPIKSSAWKRLAAYLTTLCAVILIILLVMLVVIPEVIRTVNTLFKQMPGAFESAVNYFQSVGERWPQFNQVFTTSNFDVDSLINTATQLAKDKWMVFLNSTFGILGGVLSGIMTFFIGFTFSVYLLFQKEKLGAQIKKLLYSLFSIKKVDKIIYIGRLTNSTFSNFLSGQCLEAVILGTMFFISMSLLRLPYALITGVFICVTALIPIFGAFLGLAVGAFLILMVNPIQALEFVILFFVLQQIEGNLIYPHVVGGSVGLPSIWVLVAVTIGGNLMGIVGMLIFIPICSVGYALLRDFVNNRLLNKKIPVQKFTGKQDETSQAERPDKKGEK